MGCCLGEDANLAAALAQSLFFRPRERRPPRGRRRRAMAVEALVPPDATRVATRGAAYSATRRSSVHECPETDPRARFSRSVYTPAYPRLSATSQQCTQMPQNGAERPYPPICVHSCIPTVVHNVATVYTNAPKRRREAVLADLCTLLPHRPSGEVRPTGAVTQPPTHTNSRSLLFRLMA